MSAAHPTFSIAEVDRCLAEADSLRFTDHARMLAVASAAATQAQSLGDFYRYAVALNQQAWAYAALNRYESSLTYALEALTLARAYGHLDAEGHAVNIIALNFAECGIPHESIQLYEHQLEVGRQLADDEITAMALHDLALIYLGSGDLERALGLLLDALQRTPPDRHNGLDLSITHGNLALTYEKLGRLDEALQHAEIALQLAEGTGSPPMKGQAHFVLGSIQIARGNLQEARAHACSVEQYAGKLAGMALNYETLQAAILAKEGHHRESIAALERAYGHAIGAQNLESTVEILNSLTAAYEQTGDLAGVVSAYQRMTRDVPEQQKRSGELRFNVLRAVFAMDRAAVQAKLQLNSQKNAILHRLSHEFRTPLTVIQSTADLIQNYGERLTLEQRQERLQRISGQVRWMTVLLEDIVEMLNLEDAGFAALPAAPFTLDDLAQAALAGLERYRLPNAVVRLNIPNGTCVVHAPQRTVETILIHLLSNAVKFSRTDVQLDLSADERVLVMRVADEGIGIPSDEQKIVFQPLVRGSNLDEVSGNGLGLALVARLVEQLHGSVHLDSKEGVGTTVIVRVPIVAV